MRWLYLFTILFVNALSISVGNAQFSVPPSTAISYSFNVLPKPNAATATPRKIIEAVSTSTRNTSQQALWSALGQPVQARIIQQRIPTDRDVMFRSAAAQGNPNTHAQLASYVELTYWIVSGTTALQQVTTTGTLLLAHSDLQFSEQVVDSQFSALPIEQAGYLGNGTQPFDTSNVQWGMHAMRFPQAWEKIKGNAYVGIVDNGIDVGHPDLQANFRPQFSRHRH